MLARVTPRAIIQTLGSRQQWTAATPSNFNDYEVGAEEPKTRLAVGEVRRRATGTAYYYEKEKYMNDVSLLGRVVGRIFINERESRYGVGEGSESVATFLISTKKVYESREGVETVQDVTHRVKAYRPGLIRLIEERNLGMGCRLMVNGSLRYYESRKTPPEASEGETIVVSEPYILANDIYEIHTTASNNEKRNLNKPVEEPDFLA